MPKLYKILTEINLMTIMELRKLSLVKFVYKFEKNNMFKEWYERTKLSSRDKPRLMVPVCKTEKFKNSVRWSSIKIWNDMLTKR